MFTICEFYYKKFALHKYIYIFVLINVVALILGMNLLRFII